MLDLRWVVANPEQVKKNLENRGDPSLGAEIDRLIDQDGQRKHCIQKVEELKRQRNEASQQIATLKKSGKDASENIQAMKSVSAEIKSFDDKLAQVETNIRKILDVIPNQLHCSVPVGKSEQDNQLDRQWGTIRSLSFEPRPHYEIGENLGLLDFAKAGQVTGARFVYLKGLAARLERALVNFMIDLHTERGYEEIIPPTMINREAMYGTAHLPKFEQDAFKIDGFDYFLSPTAEVPVTNYHSKEILEEELLPKKYVAFSPCFRSEAGSYGKDTKGLKRQHQFEKVELVKFSHPDHSFAELEAMVGDAERVLQKLNLPYRVMSLCSADIGFSSQKTYDLEVWSPFAGAYMEISSCSNCGDFQARRASIRFRESKSRKVHFVHTLNGSGLAIGRTLLAIMENYQKEDGTFEIPEALKSYL